MKTFTSPAPAVSLAPQLYFQLVHTLTALLPPPLDDTPDALLTRNLAAIAKVAAMLPVNANETDLAAQCIAARAQAEDLLRLLRQHEGDIGLTIRLNAQYASMVRTSLSAQSGLLRVQAARRKREAIEGVADQDDRRRQVVEQCMLVVADPDNERLAVAPLAAREEAPLAAPPVAPETAPEATPVPHRNQGIAEKVSKTSVNSHGVAFETRMSDRPTNQAPESPEEIDLREHILEAIAELTAAWPESPADGRENPARTG